MDMNIETTTVAAKRRLPEEEEEAKHMQIDGGLAKRVKRKQDCKWVPNSKVMEASLNWSPKST